MSRHRRLLLTMRSPQRQARTWRSRRSRILRRELREHYASEREEALR